jgi:hypothetical protein
MISYVFVYSSSRFKVGGTHPLMRFEPGKSYPNTTIAIPAGTEDAVESGIYGICSDADDLAPDLSPTDAQITSDYDQVTLDGGGKDGWPSVVTSASTLTDDSQRRRILSAFPSLTDTDLKEFLTSLGI